MTTINPMRPFGTSAVIVPSDINDDWTYVGAAGHYKTADLLAALDATPNTEVRELRVQLAEEAEATIERVRELTVDGDGEWIHRGDLLGALDPKPAFVLPTKAGAVIEYTDHDGSKCQWFRTRETQRPWIDREGNTWDDTGVKGDIAGDFTILLGSQP
jgi:hypothetical protein